MVMMTSLWGGHGEGIADCEVYDRSGWEDALGDGMTCKTHRNKQGSTRELGFFV